MKIFQSTTAKESREWLKRWTPSCNLEEIFLFTHYMSTQEAEKREIFSIKEAAEYLKTEVSTLKNYMKKQMINWEPVGKGQVFRKVEDSSHKDVSL